jgi:hypothetical protein
MKFQVFKVKIKSMFKAVRFADKPHPARDLEVSRTAENPTASLLIHLGMNSEAHSSSPLKRTKDGSTSSLQPVSTGFRYEPWNSFQGGVG